MVYLPTFKPHIHGKCTLRVTNISHLGKRKIIDSKVPLTGDMLVPRRVGKYKARGKIYHHGNLRYPPQGHPPRNSRP